MNTHDPTTPKLQDAVDAHDADRIREALAVLDPDHIDHVFAMTMSLQSTRPDLALLLLHWVITRPRPEPGDDQEWLRAHNNACVVAIDEGDDEIRLDVAVRSLAVAADNVPIFHNAACTLCALGMADEAMNAVIAAVSHGYDHCVTMVDDPDLELLSDRPEFHALLDPETPDDPAPPEIIRILEKLKTLRGCDRQRNYMMRARLDEAEIVEFECGVGIHLPTEYRAFLLHVGDGGAGRHMLFRLVDTWAADTHGDLSANFIPERSDRNGKHDGLITISHEENATWAHLVITGPARGQMWTEKSGGTLELTGQSFTTWYESWLDERISALEEGHTSEMTAVYAAVRTPGWASPWTPEEFARFLRLTQIEILSFGLAPDFSRCRGGNVQVEGAQFLLRGVGASCRNAAPQAWPTIIDEHFSALLTPAPRDPAELRSALRVRIHPEGHLPDTTILRPYARGLVLTLALDLPMRVESVTSTMVERLGLPVDELFDLGLANLRQDPRLEAIEVEGLDPIIHTWSGESVFSASHALRIEDYVDGDAGPLFVLMPCRHVLVVAPANAQFNDIIGDLIAFGHHAFESEPGGLSPDPYLWRKGELTRIASGIGADGSPWCVPPDELLALAEG